MSEKFDLEAAQREFDDAILCAAELGDDDPLNRWIDNRAIEALAEIARLRAALAEREWVSVEERPLHSDINLRYLATDGDEVVPAQLLPRADDGSFWWAYENREPLWFTPTHYMPLPAPPEVTP